LSIFRPSWLELAVTGQLDASPVERLAELALVEPALVELEPDGLLPDCAAEADAVFVVLFVSDAPAPLDAVADPQERSTSVPLYVMVFIWAPPLEPEVDEDCEPVIVPAGALELEPLGEPAWDCPLCRSAGDPDCVLLGEPAWDPPCRSADEPD